MILHILWLTIIRWKHIRPVNLYSLFLFWKPGSVCDPEENQAPYFLKKNRVQKTKVVVIQKEKRQPGIFSFWITMTLFFCTLLFAKSRVQKNQGQEKRQGCLFSFWKTMTLIFAPCFFQKAGRPIFFQGHKPTLVSKIVSADWLGHYAWFRNLRNFDIILHYR